MSRIDKIDKINGRMHRSLPSSRRQKLLQEKKEIIFGEVQDVGTRWKGQPVEKEGIVYFEMWRK